MQKRVAASTYVLVAAACSAACSQGRRPVLAPRELRSPAASGCSYARCRVVVERSSGIEFACKSVSKTLDIPNVSGARRGLGPLAPSG